MRSAHFMYSFSLIPIKTTRLTAENLVRISEDLVNDRNPKSNANPITDPGNAC